VPPLGPKSASHAILSWSGFRIGSVSGITDRFPSHLIAIAHADSRLLLIKERALDANIIEIHADGTTAISGQPRLRQPVQELPGPDT
jgi:hypothetical protein